MAAAVLEVTTGMRLERGRKSGWKLPAGWWTDSWRRKAAGSGVDESFSSAIGFMWLWFFFGQPLDVLEI